jgi:hypothetical protein
MHQPSLLKNMGVKHMLFIFQSRCVFRVVCFRNELGTQIHFTLSPGKCRRTFTSCVCISRAGGKEIACRRTDERSMKNRK